MADSFSVAMCTYNGGRFVGEQLESIAAQTLAPSELVVCDDRSTDETVRVVEHFATSAPFPVRLLVNERNLGSTKNFARALSLCEGDIVALSDQDDVWLPGKLARFAAEFGRAPAAGLVFSDAEIVDERTRPTGQRLWEQVGLDRAERERLSAGRAIGDLLSGATVTGATMALRARLRSLVLPVPDGLHVIHDAWMALLIACVSQVRALDEPLVLYRRHNAQQVGPLTREETVGGLRAVAAGETKEAMRRENPYDAVLALALAARLRLFERQDEFDSRAARAELDARIAHLEARRDLPRARLRRAPRVLRELLTLRYHRYAKGVASAAKDLLA
ncbi:MAG TPA: glycosyltransferase family 2 protein [Pyrinomonadaceae bacterium]|nr:glycosyltransferase family 2 protein [Pyrinomonadaceae bacterium]